MRPECKHAVMWIDPIDGPEEKFQFPRCMKKERWLTPELCVCCDSYLTNLTNLSNLKGAADEESIS